MDSDTTVIIPFDFRVIFIGSLNGAQFSVRLSEGAKPFNTISGLQSLVGRTGLAEGRFLGTILSQELRLDVTKAVVALYAVWVSDDCS